MGEINAGRVVTELVADPSKFQAGIKTAVRETDKLTDSVEDLADSISDALGKATRETNLPTFQKETNNAKKEVDKLNSSTRQATTTTGRFGSAHRDLLNRVRRTSNEIRNEVAQIRDFRSAAVVAGNASSSLITTFAGVGAAVLALDFGVRGLTSAFSDLVATANETARIEAQFANVAGSAAEGREQFQRVESIAQKLGLEITSLTQNYARLAAATRGTALEGEETFRIFESLSKAVRANGLSTGEASRAFQAMTQIASKGVLSMEELRGQLSEAIPSAMRDMATAMGVTVPQMVDMVSQGNVLAKDVLPRFAEVMGNNAAGAAEEMADSIEGANNRLRNSFREAKNAIIEFLDFESQVKTGANVLSTVLDAVTVTANRLATQFGRAKEFSLEEYETQFQELQDEIDHTHEMMSRLNEFESNPIFFEKFQESIREAREEQLRLIDGMQQLRRQLGFETGDFTADPEDYENLLAVTEDTAAQLSKATTKSIADIDKIGQEFLALGIPIDTTGEKLRFLGQQLREGLTDAESTASKTLPEIRKQILAVLENDETGKRQIAAINAMGDAMTGLGLKSSATASLIRDRFSRLQQVLNLDPDINAEGAVKLRQEIERLLALQREQGNDAFIQRLDAIRAITPMLREAGVEISSLQVEAGALRSEILKLGNTPANIEVNSEQIDKLLARLQTVNAELREESFAKGLQEIEAEAKVLDGVGDKFDRTAARYQFFRSELLKAAKLNLRGANIDLEELRRKTIAAYEEYRRARAEFNAPLASEIEASLSDIDAAQRALGRLGDPLDAVRQKIQVVRGALEALGKAQSNDPAVQEQIAKLQAQLDSLIGTYNRLQVTASSTTILPTQLGQEAARIKEQVQTPFEEYRKQIMLIRRLAEEQDDQGNPLLDEESTVRALKAAERQLFSTTFAADALRIVGDGLKEAFTGTMDAIISGTKSASQAFADLGRSILLALGNAAITRALENLSQNGFDIFSKGGFLQGVLGLFGLSKRAKGGVSRSREQVLAGESGPEAIMSLGMARSLIGGTQVNDPVASVNAHADSFMLRHPAVVTLGDRQPQVVLNQRQLRQLRGPDGLETLHALVAQMEGRIKGPVDGNVERPAVKLPKVGGDTVRRFTSPTAGRADVELASGSMLRVPAFQNGGRVTSPTLAMLGERGGETIIPDAALRNMSPNIQQDIIMVGNESDAEAEKQAREALGHQVRKIYLEDIQKGRRSPLIQALNLYSR